MTALTHLPSTLTFAALLGLLNPTQTQAAPPNEEQITECKKVFAEYTKLEAKGNPELADLISNYASVKVHLKNSSSLTIPGQDYKTILQNSFDPWVKDKIPLSQEDLLSTPYTYTEITSTPKDARLRIEGFRAPKTSPEKATPFSMDIGATAMGRWLILALELTPHRAQ
jgi:hypothetical protein